MQTTLLPTHDLRAPFRVRFTALSTNWVREFSCPLEAARFARTKRLEGKPAVVVGGGLESRRVA
jgi:hypothetical protein